MNKGPGDTVNKRKNTIPLRLLYVCPSSFTQECDFNKETEEIRLKRKSIWDMLANRKDDVSKSNSGESDKKLYVL